MTLNEKGSNFRFMGILIFLSHAHVSIHKILLFFARSGIIVSVACRFRGLSLAFAKTFGGNLSAARLLDFTCQHSAGFIFSLRSLLLGCWSVSLSIPLMHFPGRAICL